MVNMNIEKIKNIPKRVKQDLEIMSLAENWKDVLSAKLHQTSLHNIKLRNGVVMSAPSEVSLAFLFHEIWLDKVYSPAGYEIKPGDVVFDIGGNVGVFALYAATRAKNVKVYSFEPFPENAKYFERNLKDSRLKNVEFFNVAVSDEVGTRVLNVHDSWIKHSLNGKSSEDEGITVNCTSLNQAMEKIDKCDLLKIDCEGSEYEILYSCSTETLKKVKKIVGEYHNLDDGKRNGESLLAFLKENNFQIDVFERLDEHSGFICAKAI